MPAAGQSAHGKTAAAEGRRGLFAVSSAGNDLIII